MRAVCRLRPVLAGLTLLAAVIYIKTLGSRFGNRNSCVVRLCGICLYQQPLPGDQRRYAGRFAAGAGYAMVLSAGRDLLSCDLLAVCRHRLLSCDTGEREDGRDENFAQTWYVFWVLPLVFIYAESVYDPKYADTLYTGRVLQGYFVMLIALLFLMLFFNAIFLLMAISINRNVDCGRTSCFPCSNSTTKA